MFSPLYSYLSCLVVFNEVVLKCIFDIKLFKQNKISFLFSVQEQRLDSTFVDGDVIKIWWSKFRHSRHSFQKKTNKKNKKTKANKQRFLYLFLIGCCLVVCLFCCCFLNLEPLTCCFVETNWIVFFTLRKQ